MKNNKTKELSMVHPEFYHKEHPYIISLEQSKSDEEFINTFLFLLPAKLVNEAVSAFGVLMSEKFPKQFRKFLENNYYQKLKDNLE